jgi:hypothetical protein
MLSHIALQILFKKFVWVCNRAQLLASQKIGNYVKEKGEREREREKTSYKHAYLHGFDLFSMILGAE